MQARLAFVCSTIILILTGCSNTINRAQYYVQPAHQEGVQASISEADRGAVIAIVTQTAGQLSLRDLTSISRIPNTLAFFQGALTDHPIKLVARESDGQIVVDFMHTPGSLGETESFRQARQDLLAALRTRFGSRVKVASIPEVQPSRPNSGAQVGP